MANIREENTKKILEYLLYRQYQSEFRESETGVLAHPLYKNYRDFCEIAVKLKPQK